MVIIRQHRSFAMPGQKRILEHGQAVYYWCTAREKGVKVRVERLVSSGDESESADPEYLVQSGKRFRLSQVFDSRDDCAPTLPASGGASALAPSEPPLPGEPPLPASGGPPALASGEQPLPRESPLPTLASGDEPPLPASGGAPAEAPTPAPGDPGANNGSQTDADEDATCKAYAEVVGEWIDRKSQTAVGKGKSLPQWIQETFPMTCEFRQQFLSKVPWPPQGGYTSFLRAASGKTKGNVHVAMFNFGEKGLHGKGMYVGDSSLWLKNLQMPMNLKRLDIVPVSSPGQTSEPAPGGATGDLAVFGYGADGAMINSTIMFAMCAVVLYAIETDTEVPQKWQRKLQNIPALYTRHENSCSRLVSSMVTSAVNRKINRSMDDPLMLSRELLRCGLASGSNVRQVVRLYKARTMSSPTLQMKRSTEEATIKLMDRAKVCEEAVTILSRIALKHGWEYVSADAIMAPRLVLGCCLVESSNESWNTFAVQTAEGQTAVLKFLEASLDTELAAGSEITKWVRDGVDLVSRVFGLWQKVQRDLLPALLLPPKVIGNLSDQLDDRGGSFFTSLSEIWLMEPPVDLEDDASMLAWIVKNIPAIRRAQEEHRKSLRETAETSPAAMMNGKEKNDLTTGIYLGQLTLDVHRYREARQKVKDKQDTSETIANEAKSKHIANVRSAQARVQEAEVVFDMPAPGGTKEVNFLASAVQGARDNLKKLSTALQVPPTDISVFNIVALQTRGMLNSKVLDAVRLHVLMGGLPGPILIVYPLVPKNVSRAKKTLSLNSGGGSSSSMFDGISPASGGDDGVEDSSSNDDDFNEDGQLPEMLTRGTTLMTAWQRAAALAK